MKWLITSLVLALPVFAEGQTTNLVLERAVYSFLIPRYDWRAMGTVDANTNTFTVVVATQNHAPAAEIEARFGKPASILTNQAGLAWPRGEKEARTYRGDVWYYGRVGVLIEGTSAVAVVRQSRITGVREPELWQWRSEALSIGLSDEEKQRLNETKIPEPSAPANGASPRR